MSKNNIRVNYVSCQFANVVALDDSQREAASRAMLEKGRASGTGATAKLLLGIDGLHQSARETAVGVLLAKGSEPSLDYATETYRAIVAAQQSASNHVKYAAMWLEVFFDVTGRLVPDDDNAGLFKRVGSCKAVTLNTDEGDEFKRQKFNLASNGKMLRAYSNYWQNLATLERIDKAPTFESVAEKQEKQFGYVQAAKMLEAIAKKAKDDGDVHANIRNAVNAALNYLNNVTSKGTVTK